MKIAFTADVHLNPDYPERAAALENILQQVDEDNDIECLIIAGDLFDKDGETDAYESFRTACRKYPGVPIYVIPGNHDPVASLRDQNEPNLTKILEPDSHSLGGIHFLFLPYCKDKSMGEVLLEEMHQVGENPWVLIGHGDYVSGNHEPNPLEGNKIYMPLKRGDLETTNPKRVFLGHIHKPTPLNEPIDGKVIYPGSPQGLHISETGPRRFLVYDTDTDVVDYGRVNVPKIFFDEEFFVIPSEDEESILLQALQDRLDASGLSQDELREKGVFRFTLEGFTRDRDALVELFDQRVKELQLPLHEDTEYDGLLTADDPQKNLLAEDVVKIIDQLEKGTDALFDDSGEAVFSCVSVGGNEPTIEELKKAALTVIYQAK